MNDDLEKKICGLMKQAVQNQQTAGVSLLVRKDGEELFFGACGYADIEKQEALGRDHIFRLFSMTKPVTAVAAMILVERGMLDLNMENTQVDSVRFILWALTDISRIEALRENYAHIEKVYEAALAANASVRYTKVEG